MLLHHFASMRRFWIAILLLTAFSATAMAQSSPMTDSQVLSFVKKEYKAGTSNSQIVTKLIEKGVPVSQIQRIRRKYQREQANAQAADVKANMGTNTDMDSENEGRTRRNNGDSRNDYIPTSPDPNDDYEAHVRALLPDSTQNDDNLYSPQKSQKKIFGHDIFNNKKLTFEPDMNIATPADYRLGPGDAVFVDIYGASQKNIQATVSPDGDINIDGYGPVQVSGLTVDQANSKLRNTLGRYYNGSSIKVSVGQTKSISINVMGAVEAPGTYTLSAFSTVFHALYMAGGINEIGSLRDIRVYRNGRLITTVDVYDYILNGNLKGNVRLSSGDVVVVSTYDCLVNIAGKVKRPMYYEMKRNESVATLVKYAGGYTGDAYTKNVRLIRKSGGSYSIHTIDEYDSGRFQVDDGDSVFVDAVLNRYSNIVEIKGAIMRPGTYQVDDKITTVRQLLETAGGLREDAIRERGVMHRRKENRTIEAIAVDIAGILAHTAPDITLQNEDVLYIPGNEDILSDRKLTILGEVMRPGDYDYAENTCLEDLILQAGGLTESASTMRIEVARRIRNNNSLVAGSEIAKSYTFDLKDGFVVRGTPSFTLEPYDEVFVRKSPGYMAQEHVTISGEVPFTGIYALKKKNYRISDLVLDAGGTNAEAYLHGAHLTRLLSDDERTKQKELLRSMAADSVDIRKIDAGETKNIGINLEKALANPGSDEWDIVLQHGDELIVPQINNTVTIGGEVLHPNTVGYAKGQNLNYYINQAGGFTDKARSRKVYAVNMNGTVTRVKKAKDIEPGCTIVVPTRKSRKGLGVTEFVSIASITATVAAVIATLVK